MLHHQERSLRSRRTPLQRRPKQNTPDLDTAIIRHDVQIADDPRRLAVLEDQVGEETCGAGGHCSDVGGEGGEVEEGAVVEVLCLLVMDGER